MTKEILLVAVFILAGGCFICLFSRGVPEPSQIRFRDVAKSANFNFVLNNNPTPQTALPSLQKEVAEMLESALPQ